MKVAELGIKGRACDGECEGVQATVCVKANLGYVGRPGETLSHSFQFYSRAEISYLKNMGSQEIGINSRTKTGRLSYLYLAWDGTVPCMAQCPFYLG